MTVVSETGRRGMTASKSRTLYRRKVSCFVSYRRCTTADQHLPSRTSSSTARIVWLNTGGGGYEPLINGKTGHKHQSWKHQNKLFFGISRQLKTDADVIRSRNSPLCRGHQIHRQRWICYRHKILTAPSACGCVTEVNKNLAIANRSRVSCAHDTSRASIVTPSP